MDVEDYEDVGDEEQMPSDKTDLSNPDVVTKYKLAAEIANQALALVITQCVPGRRIVELCHLGDEYILSTTDKQFNKKVEGKKMLKGIGFPTTISVNEIAGAFSPMSDDQTVLKAGDLLKICLGVQFDGYVAHAGHTFVLNGGQPVFGRQADVIAAVFTAAECAMRLLRPDVQSHDFTKMFARVAEQFQCQPLLTAYSEELQRFVEGGDRCIPNRVMPEEKINSFALEPGHAYSFDIVMSTGTGKAIQAENIKSTVFRRNPDCQYQLKLKKSRMLLTEINNKFPAYPFSLRCIDESYARLGLVECLNHGLLTEHPVRVEKAGEFIAQLKFTVLMGNNGVERITGLPVDPAKLHTGFRITDNDINALLSQPIFSSKAAKKKKKKQIQVPNFVPAHQLAAPAVAMQNGMNGHAQNGAYQQNGNANGASAMDIE